MQHDRGKTAPSGPDTSLDLRSLELRRLIVDALVGGGQGHIGPSMSLVEILRVLYDDVLRFRPGEPEWPARDRLILSKGHGCLALYAILADKQFFSRALLPTFCQIDSPLGGHPERGRVPGVEASTGALGHGLSIGVGAALSARIRASRHRVFVVLGDGELNEGSIWEAALSAASHGLSSLTIVVDHNRMQCYGPTSAVIELEPLTDKWRSFGFGTVEVDGHDVEALRAVFARLPVEPGRPSAIICHTVKGKGFHFAEGNVDWHYKVRFTPTEIAMLYEAVEPAGSTAMASARAAIHRRAEHEPSWEETS